MKQSTLYSDGGVNARLGLRNSALLWALALGALAEVLIRVPGRPGLNVALWAVAGVAVLGLLARRRAEPVAQETRWLVGGALGFACLLVLRDAEALFLFSMFAAVVLLVMATGRAASAWATRAHVTDIMIAAARVGVLYAAGPLGWGRGTAHSVTHTAGWAERARTVGRGTVMAVPALLIIGSLLMSADPVFARVIEDTFLIEIETVVEHLMFAAVVAWLTCGYLRAFLIRDAIVDRVRVPHPALAPAEVCVSLWLVNLLFLGFMAVQLRYLFGGADLIEVTPGLSYAEYARRGFFELVLAAALAVPMLLLADWAVAQSTSRSRSMLRGTMIVLILLLLGVNASAAYRMRLYQEAYGMTELRLYVSAVIVWMTAVLGWLVLTVLRGRRERFAFGSVLAGLGCIAALHGLNPHALIARVNIDRAVAGAEYDGEYLRTLSADAVPALLARLEELPEAEGDRIAQMIEERWSGERRGGWRTWNFGDWRARQLVREGAVRKYLERDPRAEEQDGRRKSRSRGVGERR